MIQFVGARVWLWIGHLESARLSRTIWETMSRRCLCRRPARCTRGMIVLVARRQSPYTSCRCPIGSFADVGEAEFPVFVGCVDARTEPLRLFVFDMCRKILTVWVRCVQVILEVADRPVALLPEGLLVDQLIGRPCPCRIVGGPGDESPRSRSG